MISRRDLYAMGEPFGDSCTRIEAGRLICGGGGGGGGKSTTTTEIPKELKPLASAYANKAMALSNSPYQGYSGQQVASPNWIQDQAAQGMANQFFYGNPAMNAANSTVANALNSGNAATQNPYGYINNGGSNAYAGQNKYLQQNIDAALGDITRNYNDAIAPGLTTQMVGSGSFGNTGAQAATQNALNDLTKNLANTASGMRMQDYSAQQQLAENQLNRNLQTNQFNAGLGQDYASRNDSLRGQMLGLAPTYQNQNLAVNDAYMKAGQMYQDNAQQGLDAQYQNWLDQQNDPYKKLAAMAGVFGSGLGTTTTTKSSGGGK